jgi:hypothetical protein
MKLLEHIENLRKAQLQEFFIRWFPSEKMTSDRDRLVEQLKVAMSDPKTIRERFNRLTKSGQDFLVSLLMLPEHRGTVDQIRGTLRGRSIENFEIEHLVKNLINEAWIIPVTEASNGIRLEVYILPEEISAGLGSTIAIEQREASAMLSLTEFLAAPGTRQPTNGVSSLDAFLQPESIHKRLEALDDAELREAAREALVHHGGILTVTAWRSCGGAGERRLHRKEWREALEGSCLGTTGVLSLKSCGIDLEEECLVIFQEVVQASLRQRLSSGVENDKEFSLGIDLLIDIRRLLEVARSETLEVTREGTVFRKTEERIASLLLSSHYKELFEGSPIQHLIALAKRLRLLDQGDHYMRTDPMRRKLWLKKRIPAMVRSVFDLYQKECRGARWSFHQRAIRNIFLEEFLKLPPASYTPVRPLFTLCIARYLSAIKELDVAKTFRDLQTEEFHHSTLMVPIDRLYQDLSYWVVHRLAIVGVVDLGFHEGAFQSLRISTLGARLLKVGHPNAGRGRLVVNPDFELLLFPGDKHEAELNYYLSAFAERTASDWVKRYRLTPESIKRGIISGYGAEAVTKFLEKHSESQLPANVRFSIREWAEGIEPILRQRVLLLKAQSERGLEELSKLLTAHEIPHEKVGERAVVVRGVRNERKIRELQETFQNAGLYLE